MSRSMFVPSMALIAAALVGCPAPECDDGEELVDGECVAVDTDTDTDVDTDTDTDVAAPEALFSRITVTWTIESLPSDQEIFVDCDGRTVIDEGPFTFFDTFSETVEVTPNESCTIRLEDPRGGQLAGGTVTVCDERVASWPASRGTERVVAEFNADGCIPGCTDPVAENYDSFANLDDETCEYILGCTDDRAPNYNPSATKDDGSCDFGGFGPIELTVFFDDSPTDTTATLRCGGAVATSITGRSADAWQTRSVVTAVDAGFDCVVELTDRAGDAGPAGQVSSCGETAMRWERVPAQPSAYTLEVGSLFTSSCSGCTDPVASNFDSSAQIDDGSCQYPQ